jgi:hypothetical protein
LKQSETVSTEASARYLAESPFITKEIVKEWMYATEAFVIYNDTAPDALVDHALHLGVPIIRRSL